MRIATDDAWPASGIGTFAKNVFDELASRDHELRSLTSDLGRLSGATVVRPLAIAARLRTSDADVFYNPGFYPPVHSGRIPVVVTVHDLQYLRSDTNPSELRRHFFERVLVPLLARADVVHTVSPESANDIQSILPQAEVVVVGEGLSKEFFEVKNVDPEVGEFRIIYVGNWLAHKRVPVLLSAILAANSQIRERVVVSLPSGPNKESVPLLTRLSEVGVKVELRPELSTKQLAREIARADLLTLLSTTEGFGLTPIEAQAVGTPVLVSRFNGAEERYRPDGAHYVERDASVAEVAATLSQLSMDADRRASTVGPGRRNATTYQWPSVVDLIEGSLTAIDR